MRQQIIGLGIALALCMTLATGAARADTACTAADATAAQLKSPLIKANDDAIQMAKEYFRMATDQRDMFDKRKYGFDVARTGEVWTATLIFMRRPRYPWDEWKRRGRVGKVTLCGYDGRLMGLEASY
jgi:hypothetical protein